MLAVAVLLGPVAAPGSRRAEAQDHPFLSFVRAEADRLRRDAEPPASPEAWRQRRDTVRDRLVSAVGGFPAEPCPLEPRTLGSLRRDGYRVERVVFQTLPGVWMTANAYVPDRKEAAPAVLCVHGHWPKAKQDPVVQARCIGLARLGFFVLAVDAFGAGERGVGKPLGEYHGAMTGAMLLPVGRPLAGVQLYENIRAVDYLQSRPEVDGRHVGVTGASGGGNQSMYAGAVDGRFTATVPVCSVGSYRAYLGAACCMCEVVPGAVQFAEVGDVLGLSAPRGLMVVSATRDAPQFSVAEARRSLTRAAELAGLVDRPDRLRHTIIESGHDYNRDMREAMYGWMTLHLEGEGSGEPIAEPQLRTEDPETLRCYPGDTRPDDFVTIPRFARTEAERLLSRRGRPATAAEWRAAVGDGSRRTLAASLRLPSGPSAPLAVAIEPAAAAAVERWTFTSEPGIALHATRSRPVAGGRQLTILLHLDGQRQAAAHASAPEVGGGDWMTVELRATGAAAVPGDAIGSAADHNSAEWSLWIGRPLLGQWVHDVRRTIDAVREHPGTRGLVVRLCGIGPAGLVALAAAAVDDRVAAVECRETLASLLSDEPYRGQRLGTLVPWFVRDVGDIAHLAALVAPRPLTIADGVLADGTPASLPRLQEIFAYTREAYAALGRPEGLEIVVAPR